MNGLVVTKPSSKVPPKSVIKAEQEHPWVSRGGLKLAHALASFNIDVTGKICLDVGASTGGFTDVLLSQGASHVYAVDVGRDQLHKRLRGHPRMTSMEGTDARQLTTELFENLPELIVCDASFISAAKVLGRSMELVKTRAELMTLVKPQFEVGPENIGRGGLVKDIALSEQALNNFKSWVAEQGWSVDATDISPIKGGDGNTEYLLYGRKK